MSLKLYADTPARRTRQVVSDLWFVAWTVLWIWAAIKLYDLVLMLGAPGAALESGGDGLSGNMISAGDTIDGLPVVGESVRAPFDRMSEAGQAIADAGRGQQEAVGHLAFFLALCIAVMPIMMLLVIWLPVRIRFMRRAGTHNDSSTPQTTSTSSHCGRSSASRWWCSPRSTMIPRVPGVAKTRSSCMPWRVWSCATKD